MSRAGSRGERLVFPPQMFLHRYVVLPGAKIMRLRLENGAQVTNVSLDGIEVKNLGADDTAGDFLPDGANGVLEGADKISRIAERC